MKIAERRIDWRMVGDRRVDDRRKENLPIPVEARSGGDRRHHGERRHPTENFLSAAQGRTKQAKVLQGMLKAIEGNGGNGAEKMSAKEEKARQRVAQQAAEEVLRRSRTVSDVLQQTADQLRATKVIDRTVPKVEDLFAEVAAQLNAHDVGGKIRQSVMGNFVALRRTAVISPNMPPGSASLAALLHSTLRVIDPNATALLQWKKRPCAKCPEPQEQPKYPAQEATTASQQQRPTTGTQSQRPTAGIQQQRPARKPRQEVKAKAGQQAQQTHPTV